MAAAFDQELARELESMAAEDQAVFGIPPGTQTQKQEVSRRHRTRLGQIVAEGGWPGIRLVGPRGSTAAWIIVQHADADLEFQQRMLPLLEHAAEQGETLASAVPFLVDRVLVNTGHPQRYGTQFHHPQGWPVPRAMEDPAGVDQRRAAMGMQPLAEYVRAARDWHAHFNPGRGAPPDDGWPGGTTAPAP